MVTAGKVIDFFYIPDDFCIEHKKEIQNHQLKADNETKK